MKRSESKATTRGKILASAKTCFGTLGYERSTIRDIANTAGMSTGAIFASFAGKAALYEAVFAHPPITPEEAAAMRDALRKIASGSPDLIPPHRAMGATQMQGIARAALAVSKTAHAKAA